MRVLPLFYVARDLMGFHYVQGSKLNMEMAAYAERAFHAWMDTRDVHRKRVKIMFLIPRKGRKSTIITQTGPPYLLLYNHDLSIVIDSEKKERANDFLGSISRVISGEAKVGWKDTIGSWKSSDRKWRDDMLEVSVRRYRQRKEPSLVSSSVDIGYTGGAPDCLFIDDPMSPESHTDLWMTNVVNHYNGMGPVLMPNGLLVLCMTRYDDQDLAGHIQRTEGWHECSMLEMEACIRAGKCAVSSPEYPQPWHVMLRAALNEQDQSIDEVVWPTEFLHAERKKYPAFFAAQYMNDPWSNPDASFQKEDFVYAAEYPKDVSTILSTDTAWKQPSDRKTERAGDYNVLLIGKHQRTEGKVYVTDIRRGRWTMGEWGDELVKVLQAQRNLRERVARITYEELRVAKGAIEQAIRSALARWGEPCPALIQAPRPNTAGSKEERVKSIAQYFQNHQVVFVRPCKNTEYLHECAKCREFQILRNELLKFGTTVYDDCADAMADHFIADIYHAPAVAAKVELPPQPRSFYDDILKPNYGYTAEAIMLLDEKDRPYWVPTDGAYPREVI